ncbi:DUF397 domain-containing protein [Glycomyces sp. A-F 0318]|uniref:DUF397 domain-containing protein n=1 Tax=Glycomyces amatae TaxID=2881355 RepID=UPI001E3014BA|nr:DUF397 domain-containing protein [Glycomyces amatae]
MTAWRKSTRSNSAGTSECVELRRSWRKSTRSSSGSDGNCVEIAPCGDAGFHVRDSKLGDASPLFDLSERDLTALINATA